MDAFGHKQLSGTANYLASYIAGEIGCKTRAIELSSLQRSASHCASRVDILEAYQVGGAAVKAADEGDSRKMVVLQRLSDDPYQSGTEVTDVHKIANDEKLVPCEWVTEDDSYVTDEFLNYVRPLIQGDVSPVMVDGIPRHLYRQLLYPEDTVNVRMYPGGHLSESGSVLPVFLFTVLLSDGTKLLLLSPFSGRTPCNALYR